MNISCPKDTVRRGLFIVAATNNCLSGQLFQFVNIHVISTRQPGYKVSKVLSTVRWENESQYRIDLSKFYENESHFVSWRISDSNRSPQTCHACALPDELIPHCRKQLFLLLFQPANIKLKSSV